MSLPNFPFLDFLAVLLQKSVSVAGRLLSRCVFIFRVSASYDRIIRTRPLQINSLFFLWGGVGDERVLLTISLLYKTEFSMTVTLVPSLILISISEIVVLLLFKVDAKYRNALTALMCPVPVIISVHQNAKISK